MVDVTIEKCLSYIDNRFKLVILASQRAHSLNTGAESTIKCDGTKNTVVALNEIANNKLDNCALFNLVVHRCKKCSDIVVDTDKKELNQFNDDNTKFGNNNDLISDDKLSSQEDNLSDDFNKSLSFEDDIDTEDEPNL